MSEEDTHLEPLQNLNSLPLIILWDECVCERDVSVIRLGGQGYNFFYITSTLIIRLYTGLQFIIKHHKKLQKNYGHDYFYLNFR